MRISDWSSDVCSSDLEAVGDRHADVVEEQLRRIGLVLPDLVEVAAALETFAVGFDEHDRHALPRRLDLGIGLDADEDQRSEEHTSELQSLMRISYAVFCLKKKKNKYSIHILHTHI